VDRTAAGGGFPVERSVGDVGPLADLLLGENLFHLATSAAVCRLLD
jgi:hypothetical protein